MPISILSMKLIKSKTRSRLTDSKLIFLLLSVTNILKSGKMFDKSHQN